MELLLKTWNFWWLRTFPKWQQCSVNLSRHQTCTSSFLQFLPFFIVSLTSTWRTRYSLTVSINILCVTFNMLESELEPSDSAVSFPTPSWGLIHLTETLILFPDHSSYLNPQLFPVSVSNILSSPSQPVLLEYTSSN